jgi:tetrathionate reductase subunit B
MKCNLCIHRVRDGKDPACVVTCPTDCRIFGDWDDPDSRINKYLRERRPEARPFPLRPEAGTRPKVMYLPDTYAVKRAREEVELAADGGGAV